MTERPPPAPAYGGPLAPHKGERLGLPPSGPNSLASLWSRVAAWVLDALILLMPIIPLFVLLGWDELRALSERQSSDPVNPFSGKLLLPSVLAVAICAAYEIYFVHRHGATLGKKAAGIRVARVTDGAHPDLPSAVVRWAIGAVPSIVPIVFFVGIADPLWALWDGDRQCLHDKGARTVVVNR